jgi:hypothetical protein
MSSPPDLRQAMPDAQSRSRTARRIRTPVSRPARSITAMRGSVWPSTGQTGYSAPVRRFLGQRVQSRQFADPFGPQLARRDTPRRSASRWRLCGRRQRRRLDLRKARLVAWRPGALLDHGSKTRPTRTPSSRFTSHRELSDHRVRPKRTNLSDGWVLESRCKAGGRPTQLRRTSHQGCLREWLVNAGAARQLRAHRAPQIQPSRAVSGGQRSLESGARR